MDFTKSLNRKWFRISVIKEGWERLVLIKIKMVSALALANPDHTHVYMTTPLLYMTTPLLYM